MGGRANPRPPLTMTITNGYATLDEVKREAAIESLSVTDDAVLEACIEDASRMIDAHCGGRQFYAAAASRVYDVPSDSARELWLDGDWLAFTTVTNGDGTTVAASQYQAWPNNRPAKAALILRQSANVSWQPASTGDYQAAITVTGSLGYVNRAASDGASVRIVSNTKRACVLIALWLYRGRFVANDARGLSSELQAAAMPPTATALLSGFRELP